MNPQANNYITQGIKVRADRYSSNKRLGDRTLFSNIIDGKRYYSSIDAEIFFGETFIDDIVQIAWNIEQATMPLFGYNSYTFDDLAVGARQISGSFVVNFTKSGFMYDVLRNAQSISRRSLRADEPVTEGKLNWTSNFEKEHSAAWDKSFNIKVGYGDYSKNKESNTMIVLYCVQLTGCQQILSSEGRPIGETYSFIAKDIRYEIESLAEESTEETLDNEITEVIEEGATTVFAVEYVQIEKVPNETEYNLVLKAGFTGGDINNIKATIKKKDMKVITSIPIDLGKTMDGFVKIPKNYTKEIDNYIQLNTQQGIAANDVIFNIDFIVNYSVDGVQLPTFKNNVKANAIITQ